MDMAEGADERAQLEEVHADARVTAVQRLSRSLACAADYASQMLHRPSRVKVPAKPQHTDLASAAKTKALAAMKGAPKHKPRVIKFTGAVTVPVEAERVAAPADAQSLPKGWAPVCYKEGPQPVGKPMYQLKTYRSSARRQRQAAGLSSTYKRSMQAELVPAVTDLEAADVVSQQDEQRMEQWLAYARERLEARNMQQGAGEQPKPKQEAFDGSGPIRDAGCSTMTTRQQPVLALPANRVDISVAARARAMSAVPVPIKSLPLRFQGDLHAPTAALTAGSATSGAWQEVLAPNAALSEGPKLCSLASVPPESLKLGVPHSRLAAVYKGKPSKAAGPLGMGSDEEGGGDEDVDMNG